MRFRKIIEAESWKSALRELALIVAGVLIALWANNLHEEHENRAREQVTLRQILDATRENETRIRQAAYEESLVSKRVARVQPLLRAPVSADSIETLVRRTTWVSDFRPVTGVYNGLAQSGDLALIRNDSIRDAVYRFSGEITGTTPLLDATASEDLRQFMQLSVIHESGGTLKSVPQIRAIIAQIGMNADVRQQELQPLKESAAKLRQALEREIGAAHWAPPATVCPGGSLGKCD